MRRSTSEIGIAELRALPVYVSATQKAHLLHCSGSLPSAELNKVRMRRELSMKVLTMPPMSIVVGYAQLG